MARIFQLEYWSMYIAASIVIAACILQEEDKISCGETLERACYRRSSPGGCGVCETFCDINANYHNHANIHFMQIESG